MASLYLNQLLILILFNHLLLLMMMCEVFTLAHHLVMFDLLLILSPHLVIWPGGFNGSNLANILAVPVCGLLTPIFACVGPIIGVLVIMLLSVDLVFISAGDIHAGPLNLQVAVLVA